MRYKNLEFMLLRRYPAYDENFRKALSNTCKEHNEADVSDVVVDELGRQFDVSVLDLWGDEDERTEVETVLRGSLPETSEEEFAREMLRKFIDRARQFEADLQDLLAEDRDKFVELYQIDLQKDGAEKRKRGLEYDRYAFFNTPQAAADFNKWSARRSWSMQVATALSLGKDPSLVNWEKLKPALQLRNSPFAANYRERLAIIKSAVEVQELTIPIRPGAFVEWATDAKLDLPAELIATVPIPTAPEEQEGEKIHTNARHSMYAMIAGMAVEYCGIDHSYGITRDNGRVKEVAEAIEKLGLKIEKRTFKAHLRAALNWARSSEVFLAKQQAKGRDGKK